MLRRRILEAILPFEVSKTNLNYPYGNKLPEEKRMEYGICCAEDTSIQQVTEDGKTFYKITGVSETDANTQMIAPFAWPGAAALNIEYLNAYVKIVTYNFKTDKDGKTVTFEFIDRCNNESDFLGISKLDSDDIHDLQKKLTNNSAIVDYTVPRAGDHFIKIFYYQHNDMTIDDSGHPTGYGTHGNHVAFFRMEPYEITVYNYRYENPKESETLNLKSYFGWTITSKPSWVFTDKNESPSGNSSVVVTVEANPGPDSRTGKIVFTEKHGMHHGIPDTVARTLSVTVVQAANEHPYDILLPYQNLTVPENFINDTNHPNSGITTLTTEFVGYTGANATTSVSPTNGSVDITTELIRQDISTTHLSTFENVKLINKQSNPNSNQAIVSTDSVHGSGPGVNSGDSYHTKTIKITKESVKCYCDCNLYVQGNGCGIDNKPYTERRFKCATDNTPNCPTYTYNKNWYCSTNTYVKCLKDKVFDGCEAHVNIDSRDTLTGCPTFVKQNYENCWCNYNNVNTIYCDVNDNDVNELVHGKVPINSNCEVDQIADNTYKDKTQCNKDNSWTTSGTKPSTYNDTWPCSKHCQTHLGPIGNCSAHNCNADDVATVKSGTDAACPKHYVSRVSCSTFNQNYSSNVCSKHTRACSIYECDKFRLCSADCLGYSFGKNYGRCNANECNPYGQNYCQSKGTCSSHNGTYTAYCKSDTTHGNTCTLYSGGIISCYPEYCKPDLNGCTGIYKVDPACNPYTLCSTNTSGNPGCTNAYTSATGCNPNTKCSTNTSGNPGCTNAYKVNSPCNPYTLCKTDTSGCTNAYTSATGCNPYTLCKTDTSGCTNAYTSATGCNPNDWCTTHFVASKCGNAYQPNVETPCPQNTGGCTTYCGTYCSRNSGICSMHCGSHSGTKQSNCKLDHYFFICQCQSGFYVLDNNGNAQLKFGRTQCYPDNGVGSTIPQCTPDDAWTENGETHWSSCLTNTYPCNDYKIQTGTCPTNTGAPSEHKGNCIIEFVETGYMCYKYAGNNTSSHTYCYDISSISCSANGNNPNYAIIYWGEYGSSCSSHTFTNFNNMGNVCKAYSKHYVGFYWQGGTNPWKCYKNNTRKCDGYGAAMESHWEAEFTEEDACNGYGGKMTSANRTKVRRQYNENICNCWNHWCVVHAPCSAESCSSNTVGCNLNCGSNNQQCNSYCPLHTPQTCTGDGGPIMCTGHCSTNCSGYSCSSNCKSYTPCSTYNRTCNSYSCSTYCKSYTPCSTYNRTCNSYSCSTYCISYTACNTYKSCNSYSCSSNCISYTACSTYNRTCNSYSCNPNCISYTACNTYKSCNGYSCTSYCPENEKCLSNCLGVYDPPKYGCLTYHCNPYCLTNYKCTIHGCNRYCQSFGVNRACRCYYYQQILKCHLNTSSNDAPKCVSNVNPRYADYCTSNCQKVCSCNSVTLYPHCTCNEAFCKCQGYSLSARQCTSYTIREIKS